MPRTCSKCKRDETSGANFTQKARYCRDCARDAAKESRERKKTGLPPPKLVRKTAADVVTGAILTNSESDYTEFCSCVTKILAGMDKSKNFAELSAKLFSKVTMELANRTTARAEDSGTDSDTCDAACPPQGDNEIAPEPAKIAPEPAKIAPEPAKIAPEPAKIAPEPAKIAPEPAKIAPEPAKIAPEPAKIAPEPAKIALDSDELYFVTKGKTCNIGTDEQTKDMPGRRVVVREKIPIILRALIREGCDVSIIGENRPLSDNVIAIATIPGPKSKKVIACGKYLQFYYKTCDAENEKWTILDDNDKNLQLCQEKYEQVDASEICDPNYIM